MKNHNVHWSEGMFLRPHHFQAADRRARDELMQSEEWNVSYAYGLRKIEIDEDALANYRIALRACHIRLHDGTHLCYPEDATLSAIPLPKEVFDRQSRVTVSIGVPSLKLGRSNVGTVETGSRYLVDAEEMEDENRPDNPQTLEVRWPNARLFLSGEDTSGYETLPIARVRRGEQAEAPPEIDKDYIPPILACDAWPVLRDEIIGSIYNQIGSTVETLAAQMIDRGVAFESGHREDVERIYKLHVLNTALGYLRNLPFVRGVHPLVAYMELCRLVGQLAIFRPERRMPEVPLYDHDDLGKCFYAVKRMIEIAPEEKPTYIKRDFVGSGVQMQVKLEREWLSPTWSFFIGVCSKLSYPQCVALLRGELNMKVGSGRQAEDIFLRGKAGVTLAPQPDTPRLLPAKNWVYFKVSRDSAAWRDVEDTLTLAIRMAESYFVDKIDGRRELQLKTEDNREITMSFSLYALPTQYLA